jgi:hypothetical protein
MLTKLQGAWENSERKDECTVHVDDLELDYWMGTEVGQLGGYAFQGATFGVDGSSKDGRRRSDAVNSREKKQTNVHESAERRKTRVRTGRG